MRLFDLIRLWEPRITTPHTKIHLATHNGSEDPLHVYYEGWFDEWQSYQSRRNFTAEFVVSLIQLSARDRWLYVGAYAVGGHEWQEQSKSYCYELTPLPGCSEFAGRMVVNFARRGRASYLHAEHCADAMTIHEIRAERLHMEDFPGFKHVDLGWPDLEILVRQTTASWRTALSAVAGIYLISDPQAGKLYVGSACGEGGIWARWCQYVDGHGNNVELRKIIDTDGIARARTFRFSILEIADLHAGSDEVLAREAHWKRVLLSRLHGYNAN